MAVENRLELAINIAIEAGKLVREARKTHFKMDYKRGTELVTNIDKQVEQFLIESIKTHYPEDEFLAEESSPDLQLNQYSHPNLWVIDPIDGTVNFARGHFQVAVSIAFCQKGETRFGVVYCPFYDELFIGQLGQGATLNGNPISTSEVDSLDRAIIATGFPYEKVNMDILYQQLQQVLDHCADIRRVGSAACDICWVACGRLDGYYETLSPWDFAAAKLIAQEAGAKSTNLTARPNNIPGDLFGEHLFIANNNLFQALYSLLKPVTP